MSRNLYLLFTVLLIAFQVHVLVQAQETTSKGTFSGTLPSLSSPTRPITVQTIATYSGTPICIVSDGIEICPSVTVKPTSTSNSAATTTSIGSSGSGTKAGASSSGTNAAPAATTSKPSAGNRLTVSVSGMGMFVVLLWALR